VVVTSLRCFGHFILLTLAVGVLVFRSNRFSHLPQ
jgi:uncharacterized protein YqhQ